ncbi:MAG TPA: FixH family protein [Bacteroidales bacterium]|nr:FixH family protein [Bacteroidales bacterium]
MRINWGTGILIVIIIFLIAIISFVLFTTTHKINLVEEDYYPKELNYDSQMEKQANTDALVEKISFIKGDSAVLIAFPQSFAGKEVEGSILVYRPSDYAKDKLYPIRLDTAGQQFIPTGNLLPGKYIFKVDWVCDGVKYFQEQVIIN